MINKTIKLLFVILLLLPSYNVFATGGTVQTYAGKGMLGLKDGERLESQFRFPSFATADRNGNVYVSDSRNHLIRKIDESGEVTTVAGVTSERNEYGQPAGGFVDGATEKAMFNEPKGIAVDEEGIIYVADSKNGAIRKIKDGQVSTVVDGLDLPVGIVVADNGELYVTETLAHRILQINGEGNVTVIAGSGYVEEDGWLLGAFKDGVGEAAQFNEPTGIALSDDGTLWVSDTGNQRIRTILSDGEVRTIAGAGNEVIEGTPYIIGGYEDGPGNIARFRSPHGITVANDGTVYVADTLNHRVRSITVDGTVATVAGIDGYGFNNDVLLKSAFDHPYDVLLIEGGALLVVDYWNHSLRIIDELPDVATVRVMPDKVWSISFSASVDRESITQEFVFVEDYEGNKVDVTFQFTDNDTVVEVVAVEFYDPGETYLLTITDDVVSAAGYFLGEPLEIKFTTLPIQLEGRQLETKVDVEPDKVWQIHFSEEVDVETITDDSVVIVSEDGREVEVQLQLDETGKTISVNSDAPYEAGQTYYIIINGEGVKTTTGDHLTTPTWMKFSIKGV